MTIEMPKPVFLVLYNDVDTLLKDTEVFQNREEVQAWLDSNKNIDKNNITILTGNLYKVDIR